MFRLSATFRLAVGLAFIGISVLLVSRTLGLGYEARDMIEQERTTRCETLALLAASEVRHGNLELLESELQKLVDSNNDMRSAAIRRSGELVVTAGDHDRFWVVDRPDDDSQRKVPLQNSATDWDSLEVCFGDRRVAKSASVDRVFLQVFFVLATCTMLYTFYLEHMLNHLDPTKVIPDRVRAALDTFAEGLLVLDRKARILLANKAFAESVNRPTEDLQGKLMDELPWEEGVLNLPWDDALGDGQPHTGQMVDLRLKYGQKITYMVNASPIFSDKGQLQGVLASFDDVTLHEQRKRELENTLKVLGESREQIRRQNVELRLLATRDPLTGCMNRRSFFEAIEKIWDNMAARDKAVTCVMIDVDHFKSINDTYGHRVGDDVLQSVGATLLGLEDQGAIACRYGGEEFCLTLEDHDEEMAAKFAEKIRLSLQQKRPGGIEITASFGVAVSSDRNEGFQDLLERADNSLYIAKRKGRNQVVSWENIDEEDRTRLPEETATPAAPQGTHSGIPFHAVTALISALSYRDAATAEHSRRVADLCVQVGSRLLSAKEQYILETAALLHDIGKIGTPDSVLLKPGPLDPIERDVMSHHDIIGIEILRTTFDNEQLIAILSNHFAPYGGSADTPGTPTGEAIPIGARILAICDTFDSIVTDRVYRKGASRAEAFAELRRCAGVQFDPELVELFIETVEQSDQISTTRDSEVDISKRAALQIGLLMEGMAQALEHGDTREIHDQAKRLSLAATEARSEEIQTIAQELQDVALDDIEVEDLIQIASTLLDLCRITQRAYLEVGVESRKQRERLATKQFDETSS